MCVQKCLSAWDGCSLTDLSHEERQNNHLPLSDDSLGYKLEFCVALTIIFVKDLSTQC